MFFTETNIINVPKLRELATLSAPLFKSRGVYTGDHTLTEFRLLAYWGLYNYDRIDDHILFLEGCSDKLVSCSLLIDAAVLYMNCNTMNVLGCCNDINKAIKVNGTMLGNYIVDVDTIDSIIAVLPAGSEALNGMLRLRTHVQQIHKNENRIIDFSAFSKFA